MWNLSYIFYSPFSCTAPISFIAQNSNNPDFSKVKGTIKFNKSEETERNATKVSYQGKKSNKVEMFSKGTCAAKVRKISNFECDKIFQNN